MSIVKNGAYTGEVIAYGTDGEGIINTEGTTAFVPFCLVGERVRFKALKVQNGVVYGKAEEVISPSALRVQAPCPLFSKCGGCDLQHMAYAEQLKFKRGAVERALNKLGGIYAPVGEVVPCEKPYRYRNKLAMPIGVEGGRTVMGFYARRSHRIVSANDCLIQPEWAGKVIAATLKFAHVCGFSGYDENSRRGDLRQLVVREIKGKFIVALVATRKIDTSYFANELKKIFGDFTLLLNVNASTGNVIFSKEWHICRGEGKFEAEEGGIFYGAGAETFVQVNDGMREKLYAKVIEEAAKFPVAIDLYSGGGLLTAMLAKSCGRAVGVEVVKEASLCADSLCVRNGLQGKMKNVCGKVEEKLAEVLLSERGQKVIVCDPPRKGMERSVAESLKNCGAERLIMISCNPATLARDLAIICGGNFAITSVTPFDMFPQTKHVETLVVLDKKG